MAAVKPLYIYLGVYFLITTLLYVSVCIVAVVLSYNVKNSDSESEKEVLATKLILDGLKSWDE